MQINNFIISGNICQDVEVKPLQSTNLVKFSIAYNKNKKVGDNWEKEVHFFKVVMFTKNPSYVERLHKGLNVLVQGELRQNKWTDKDGNVRDSVEILAFSVQPTQFVKKETTVLDI